MEKNIILVSHCMLNIFSKVENFGEEEGREDARKKIIKTIIDNEIGIIQLPCPELIMYGSKRWGHVKDQFDTPYFRNTCKKELETYILQIEEYINNGYNIIGILGIDGSPSCGINLTCRGNWKGEIGSNPNLKDTINTISYTKEMGVMMEELKKLIKEKNIDIDMFGFTTENAEEICKYIENKIVCKK
ncbi:CD3072 family TudS-related putative desulfidase [Peptacetobacter sp.]|uniref:CD3072 family TudS-related putative desulfidase n=1 Tax=Peptacetobacter sp. TaxID=2991975 RepID=UPI002619BEFF|nr:CD3072 family TudS-related putative desulfidase [Peptacetobacter sp.]